MRLLERVVRHRVFVGKEAGFRFVEEVLLQAVLRLPHQSARRIPEMDLLHLSTVRVVRGHN